MQIAIENSLLHPDVIEAYFQYISATGYRPTPADVKVCEECFIGHVSDFENIDEENESIVILWGEYVFNINA